MELTAKNIIRSYFLIQKDVDIPSPKKATLLQGLKKASKSLTRLELKNQATEEMSLGKGGKMYKLFCQCVALTGQID
jgi:hypothetical protein